MTAQTKKFIELRDLLNLRFECRNSKCSAVLSLPFTPKALSSEVGKRCPNCGQYWCLVEAPDRVAPENFQTEILGLLQTIEKLEKYRDRLGFTLMLEINDPEKGKHE
jgi:hypothetical protein